VVIEGTALYEAVPFDVVFILISIETELLTPEGWVYADNLTKDSLISAVDDNGVSSFVPVKNLVYSNRKHYEFSSHWTHFSVDGAIPLVNDHSVLTETFAGVAHAKLEEGTGIHSYMVSHAVTGNYGEECPIGLYLYSLYSDGDKKVEIRLRSPRDKKFFWDNADSGPHSVARFNEKNALVLRFTKPAPIDWPSLSQAQHEHALKVARHAHGCEMGMHDFIISNLNEWDADWLQYAGYVSGFYSTQRRGLAVHFKPATRSRLLKRAGVRSKIVYGDTVGIILRPEHGKRILTRYNYTISVQRAEN